MSYVTNFLLVNWFSGNNFQEKRTSISIHVDSLINWFRCFWSSKFKYGKDKHYTRKRKKGSLCSRIHSVYRLILLSKPWCSIFQIFQSLCLETTRQWLSWSYVYADQPGCLLTAWLLLLCTQNWLSSAFLSQPLSLLFFSRL